MEGLKAAGIGASGKSLAGDAAGRAMLAYEHQVDIRIAAKEIPARQAQVQEACGQARFGQCVVLGLRQRGGEFPSAGITLRIAPDGVEPMIALAGAGAELGSRSTHAEDLAVVVRDNAASQDRLRRELQQLEAFQQRSDLSVADMIALAERVASTQAQLEAAEREAAQHQRRIDTGLLHIEFSPPAAQAGRGEVAQAVREFGATLATGTAWTIRALAFLLPVGAALAVVVALCRRLLRRRAR